MKRSFLVLSSLAIVILLGIGLSSCKDDEKPSKAKVSFASETKTVQESAGTVEVKVTLDRALGKDLIVSYDLAGTALEKAGTNQADYEVDGDAGEITIAKGETIGVIKLNIVNDLNYESEETIDISLTDVNSTDAEISTDDETVVTIQSDDLGPKASFLASTMTVNEVDGYDNLLEIEVTLDNPVSEDINIEYELSGTAIDSLYGFSQEFPGEYYDYYVDGESGVIPIASGETSGKIYIQLIPDFHYETNESIVITLKESPGIQLGTTKTLTITLKQQDGKIIELSWDNSYTDVDMDMFLWIGADIGSLNGVIATSINPSTTVKKEYVFIPKGYVGLVSDRAFGLSYVYYEGTANPMNFTVKYIDLVDGVEEASGSQDIYTGSYDLDNINQWDADNAPDPQIEQTLKIVNNAIAEISTITIPATGSRSKTYSIPAKFKRSKVY
jgi:hypothetical protein